MSRRKTYRKVLVESSPTLFPTLKALEVSYSGRRGPGVTLCDPRDLDLLQQIKTGRLTIARARKIVDERSEAVAKYVEFAPWSDQWLHDSGFLRDDREPAPDED